MEKLIIAKANSEQEADYVILGIPTDLGAESKRKGRIEAPEKIRELSEKWFIPFTGRIDETKIYDAGNLKLGSDDILKNIEIIKQASLKYFKKGKVVISLGGDCSIKYGLLSALNELDKKISVIYFDSHPDLVTRKKPYYGSVMADCMKLNNIDLSKSVFIGIREIEEEEMRVIKEKKILYFTPLDFKEKSIEKIFELIKRKVKGNKVYLALDMDSIDPSFAPAIGCVAPGGISSTEMLWLINRLKTLKPVGLDVTEFIPKYDIGNMTGKLVYKIIYEFMAR